MTHVDKRVLLIEDNPGDADLVRRAFSRMDTESDITWVTRLSDALERLASEPFDVVLSDLSLPDSHGLPTVVTLREEAQELPLIVLTSLSDNQLAVQALDHGAQDYLVKDDVSPSLLERSIRHAIHRHEVNAENHRLLSEVQDAKALLERKNQHLAKLYNTAQEFVQHVSHEFRTPLSVIKEYASLVRDGIVGEVNEQQHKMLNVIDDRSDDLNTMVDDMLDVSKLEAGLLGAWRKECSVAEIVQHVLPALERKAATRNVTFTTDLEAALPPVYCDAEKAGRVIVNLAINAIKFAGQPGQVELWAHARPDENDVLIGVTDNGAGISEADRDRIFERFSQLESNLHMSTKGFGLGLSIAKELAELNFGQMFVASPPSGGSTFSFTVPFADPSEVAARYVHRLQARRKPDSPISLITASIDPSVEIPLADDTNRFFNHLLRRNDVLFRIDSHRWMLLVPTPQIELDDFFSRAERERLDANRNRPRGPFPEIKFEKDRCWRLADAEQQLTERIEQLCPPLVPA